MAAGFYCRDGLVVCADTQITYPYEFIKLQAQKIVLSERDDLVAAITGAGDWEYLRLITEKLKSFLDNGPSKLEEIKQGIEDLVLGIYERQIAWSVAQPKPSTDMLIAVLCENGGQAIIRACETAVTTIQGAEVVGTGRILGLRLASLLWEPRMSIQQCVALAAYITYLAKKYVSDVGGRSHVITLTRGEPLAARFIDNPTNLESVFERFDQALRPLLLGFGDLEVSDKQFDGKLQAFNSDVRGLREYLLALWVDKQLEELP